MYAIRSEHAPDPCSRLSSLAYSQVKSWQWLALRLRVLEPDPLADGSTANPHKGKWEELTKVGEAVDWLKKIGKEHLLLDVGIGSGGHKA
jgi:hypothetical protein